MLLALLALLHLQSMLLELLALVLPCQPLVVVAVTVAAVPVEAEAEAEAHRKSAKLQTALQELKAAIPH